MPDGAENTAVPAPVQFDVAGARKAGFSDGEIADFVGNVANFNTAAARKAGFLNDEIIAQLVAQPKPPEPPQPPQSQLKADLNAAAQGPILGLGAAIAGSGEMRSAAAAQGTRRQLASMDAIDQGKDVVQDQDPIGYQFFSPEQRAKARTDFAAADTELSKREPNSMTRAGAALEQWGRDTFPVAPENEGLQTGAARAATGMVPIVLASIFGGPAGTATALATMFSQGYHSTLNEAKEAGASQEEAEDAASKSAALTTATMMVPLARVMQTVPVSLRPGLAKTLVDFGAKGVEFGTFNALSTVANNYVARESFDPERPLLKGVPQAAGEGLIAGPMLHGVGLGAGAAMNRFGSRPNLQMRPGGPEPEPEPAPAASEPVTPPAAVLAAPDLDSAIDAAAQSAATPVPPMPEGDVAAAPATAAPIDVRAETDQMATGDSRDLQQAALLKLFRNTGAGTVEQTSDGQYQFRTTDAKGDEVTHPIEAWNPGAEPEPGTISADTANAIREHYGQAGVDVVFYQEHAAIPFDGATDPNQPNTIFLSNKPDRNIAQVAAHEFTHVLADTTLPDGTSLGELLNQQVAAGLTPAGRRYAENTFGSTAPLRDGFADGPEGDKAHADAVMAHLVNELGADIGGEAPKFQSFMPRVVDAIQARFGDGVAKDVLAKLIDGLKSAMQTVRSLFKEGGTRSQNWVSNIGEIHDTLAKMYAERFGSPVEREQARLAEIRDRAERDRVVTPEPTPEALPAVSGERETQQKLEAPKNPGASDFLPATSDQWGETRDAVHANTLKLRRWLNELAAERDAKAADTPQAKLLTQTEAAILRPVGGDETKLPEAGRARLEQVREKIDEVTHPQADTPEMAKVRDELETAAPAVAVEAAPAAPAEHPILGDFGGRYVDAVRALHTRQDGIAERALSHPDIGPIDLVWGEAGTRRSDGYGLAKLLAWHPEVVTDLPQRLQSMRITSRSDNRIRLAGDGGRAVVRLDWDGQTRHWLLTAFDEKAPRRTERSTDSLDAVLAGRLAPRPDRGTPNMGAGEARGNAPGGGSDARPKHPGLIVTSPETGKTTHVQPPGTVPPTEQVRPLRTERTERTEQTEQTSRPQAEPEPPPRAERPQEAQPERPADYGANNKTFTKDMADKARERLRAKLNRLNAGFDPEMAFDGLMLAGYHVEAGARKFADYAKAMVEDLGDVVRPHLAQWYTAVRMQHGFDGAGMDGHAAVEAAQARLMTEAQTAKPRAPAARREVAPYVTVPKPPTRLTTFLQQKTVRNPGTIHETVTPGGIKDVGGNIASMIDKGRGRPGLINNKSGRSIFDALIHAWENDYLPAHPSRGPRPDDENLILDAIREDLTGNPQYSTKDQDALDAHTNALEQNSEIDRLATEHDIDTKGLTRDQFFDRLADVMSLDELAAEHARMEGPHGELVADFERSLRDDWHSDTDRDNGEPRTLEDLENEYRQEDTALAAREGDGSSAGPGGAGSSADAGEEGQGFGGDTARPSGRDGAEAGASSSFGELAINTQDAGELGNAAVSAGGLEPDRQNGTAGPVLAQGDGNAAGEAGGRLPDGGRTRGAGDEGPDGDTGASGGGAPLDGERGDLFVHNGDASGRAEGVAPGSDFDGGSGVFGDSGVSADKTAAISTPANPPLDAPGHDTRAAQAAAEGVASAPGLANIRETLPALLPGQQEDVFKTETRFGKPAGYGMLLTNGTGTGKTYSGLGTVKRLARTGRTNILIVAPDEKVASDWIKSGKDLGLEINQLTDTKDAGKGIVVTTYANFGQNDALATRQWDLVVPDESHNLMKSADATVTAALRALRALTYHPDGVLQRVDMENRPLVERIARLAAEGKRLEKAVQHPGILESLNKNQTEIGQAIAELNARRKAMQQRFDATQGEQRPRVLFLSATPFAYEKNVEWAQGFLFEHPKVERTGYNVPTGRDQFMIQHFGYRMRNNRLTEPDAAVDRGLMQRGFNSYLKREGALSSRMLDVAADYDRRFALIDSGLGNRIDQALDYLRQRLEVLRSSAGLARGKAPEYAAWSDIAAHVDEHFNYLSRMYLLEALKAAASVSIVKQHLALGRKVVVFHDFKRGGGFNPFRIDGATKTAVMPPELKASYLRALAEFNAEFLDLVNADWTSLKSPVDQYREAFGDTALVVNGDEKQRDNLARFAKFQSDESGPQVLLVQSAKNAGWSGHDTTGKHQRALINLGLPVAPTTAIQQEGRIYRTGQVSNAIFRYLNTGTNWEKFAFASKIAQRASTAENLGMGEDARALKDSFISAFLASDDYTPGHEGEGMGGKALDRIATEAPTPFARAKSFYWGTEKKTSATKAREGSDYFATPEPLGLKMVEWADQRGGEAALEPSAGHGAIARWMGDNLAKTFIEPSNELRARLALSADAATSKIVGGSFEDLNIVNKYDTVVMNPPFGVGGKTAMEHLAKAAIHTRDGGRIVALIPTGPAADKRFDAWLYGADDKGRSLHPDLHLVADVKMPAVTFERAGTSVATRVVVIDKVSDPKAAGRIMPTVQRDLSDVDTTKELFNRLENMELPARQKPKTAEQRATAAQVPAQAPAQDSAAIAPSDAGDIVEHTTQKGKVLRGVIRTDMTQTQAQAIDPYTFRKKGGYFIREAHLSKLPPNPGQAVAQPAEVAAPATVPEHIEREVKRHLDWLNSQAEDIRDASDRLNHSYGYEALDKAKDDIAMHATKVQQFREFARAKGIDPEPLIAKHGGEPDMNAAIDEGTARQRARMDAKRKEVSGEGRMPTMGSGLDVLTEIERRFDWKTPENQIAAALRHQLVNPKVGNEALEIIQNGSAADIGAMIRHVIDSGITPSSGTDVRHAVSKWARERAASPATDLLGRPVAAVTAKAAPEPTIHNDPNQTAMFGGPSAVQAQAARDQAGRGGLTGTGPQAKADEGLFAPDPTKQRPLFSLRDDFEKAGAPPVPRDVSPAEGQTLTQPASTELRSNEIGNDRGDVNLDLDAGDKGLPRLSPRATVRNQGEAERWTPEEAQAYDNVGRVKEVKTWRERIAEAVDNIGQRTVRYWLDPYIGIKANNPDGYVALRIANTSGGALHMFLTDGTLKFEGHGYVMADRNGGVEHHLIRPLQGEADRFMWWVAANRAEKLTDEDRENLFSQSDIDTLKGTNQGQTSFDYELSNGQITRDREAIYLDSLNKLDKFNRNALDLAKRSGLIGEDVVNELIANPFYVPFYRISENDGHFAGPNLTSGFVKQYAFKTLKGGQEKLNNDLWDNAIKNWAHMIDASLRNRAAAGVLDVAVTNGAATEMTQVQYDHLPRKEKDITPWIMNDGKKQYFQVEDPVLLTAISALNFKGINDPFMKAAGKFKSTLTQGVTASPAFMLRNFIRDAQQAIAVSPTSLNILGNIRTGFAMGDTTRALDNLARAFAAKQTKRPRLSDEAADAIAGGATMVMGAGHDTGAREVNVRTILGPNQVPVETVLDRPARINAFWNWLATLGREYKAVGAEAENAQRFALYHNLRAEGAPRDYAAFSARDLTDFSLRGAGAIARYLTTMVPFLNARLQGLYKVGRSAADQDRNVAVAVGKRVAASATKRIAIVMGATALMTLGLDALYADDEDYKKRSEYDRSTNWWFKVGNVQFRIPMGFEIAALSRIAANGVEAFFGWSEMGARRFTGSLLNILGANLSMNPTPQFVKPIVDVMQNQNFAGSPIVSMGMNRLQSEYQYTSDTTLPARWAGSAGAAVTRTIAGPQAQFLAPVQIDYLVNGYFGWLGSMVMNLADQTARGADQAQAAMRGTQPMEPVRPDVDLWNRATAGIISTEPTRQSRYVDMLYQQADGVNRAYATWKDLLAQGHVEDARDYYAKNKDEIAAHSRLAPVEKVETTLSRQIKRIGESRDLSPERKRIEIMRLNAMRNRAAENIYGSRPEQ